MKRILFMAAVTAVAMSSCSKNEVTSSIADAPQAITFGTYVGGASTKAAAKTVFEAGDAFGVMAYYTGATAYASSTTTPNFMYNETITAADALAPATGLTWSYSPIKYWPNGVTSDNDAGKISFFAYWPMGASGVAISANDVAGDPKVTYTLDQTNAVDLMWGVNDSGLPHIDLTKQAAADKIKFTFKHALARVGFQFQLADDIVAASTDETTVTIDKVEFGGTISGETFTSTLTEEAVLNLNNTADSAPIWTDATGTVALTLLTENFTNGGVFALNAVTDTSAAFGGVINNKDDNYFMVIPQDLSSAGTASKMRVTYTVKTEDANLVGSASSVKNIFTVDLKNFVGGTAYLYNMTIGLNSVKIEGESSAWTEGNLNYTIKDSTDVEPKTI